MSHKEYLIIKIRLELMRNAGLTKKEVLARTKGYYRKSINDLKSILKDVSTTMNDYIDARN